MMNMYNPLLQYRQQHKVTIEGADRVKLIAMLLEGAVRYNKKAIIAVEEKNIVETLENADAGYKIVMHLYNCLDLSQNEKVVENLASLYNFCCDQYYQFMKRGKPQYLDISLLRSVNSILATILDAWNKLPEGSQVHV